MASTNKTTHYELSQYIGSDKPTYLTDYNTDMSNIDTGIYNAQTKADSGYSLASTADGKADTAITNAGTAQTSASTALNNIGTMANLNTTEKTNLVGAINEVDANIKKFNLGTPVTLTRTAVTNIQDVWQDNIKLAVNSDGSIYKLYGYFSSNVISSGTCTVTYNSSLRPSTQYTVSNCLIALSGNSLTNASFTVGTNGVITLSFYGIPNKVDVLLPACIYFNKDFGDN